jgi:hypothetical protein
MEEVSEVTLSPPSECHSESAHLNDSVAHFLFPSSLTMAAAARAG